MSWVSSWPELSSAITTSSALGHVLRVERAEDHVGVMKDEVVLPLGDAHHVADDLEREPGGDVSNEVAFAPVDQLIDDQRRGPLHIVLDLRDHPRRERRRDDAPQSGVARIVEVDHRTEELEELRRHVEDARGTAPRAEQLGPVARLHDVSVAGNRVIARPVKGQRDRATRWWLGIVEVSDRSLPTKRLEGSLPLLKGAGPKRQVREIDPVDCEERTRRHRATIPAACRDKTICGLRRSTHQVFRSSWIDRKARGGVDPAHRVRLGA